MVVLGGGRFLMSEVPLYRTRSVLARPQDTFTSKQGLVKATSPQTGSKSPFSTHLICTGVRRNPATCGTNQEVQKGRFAPTQGLVNLIGLFDHQNMMVKSCCSVHLIWTGPLESAGTPHLKCRVLKPQRFKKTICTRIR